MPDSDSTQPIRLLITGGSSYLGHHLVPLATASYDVCYTYYQHDPMAPTAGCQLDVREQTAVGQLVANFQPQVIIHTAGSNRVSDMERVIVDGTLHVVKAAAAVGARLIHLSTDSIFSGIPQADSAPPYGEAAPPSPVNDYGRAKAAAEAMVRPYADHVIVRTSLIYGLQKMDHGTTWMAAALERQEPVTLFTNQVRNPVWVQTLSRACLELATHNYTGTLNVAGEHIMTRAEFGLRMLDWWRITARDTLSFATSTEGHWPLDCTLDCRRAKTILTTPLLGVDTVLAQASSQVR